MGRPSTRSKLAVPLATLLCACGSGTEPASSPDQAISAPTAAEAQLLGHVLADIPPPNTCLASATFVSQRPGSWADSLSFGDGRLAWPGDERFEHVAERWNRAAPLRSDRIRLPREAAHPRFRIVPDPGSTPTCEVRWTLYTPLFDGDMAFVFADEQGAGERPGGDVRFWIFLRRAGRWAPLAYGSASYGRMIT